MKKVISLVLSILIFFSFSSAENLAEGFSEEVANVLTLVRAEAKKKNISVVSETPDTKTTSYSSQVGFFDSYNAAKKLGDDRDLELEAMVGKHRSEISSPLFLELSSRFVRRKEIDKAAYYYMLYRLRSAYDGLRCTDKTASQGSIVLVMGRPEIEPEIPREARTEAIRKIVEAWPKDAPTASPNWLCSHGVKAFSAKSMSELITPENTWQEAWDKQLEVGKNSIK